MAFPWSDADKLSAADLNAVIVSKLTTLHAGETINGATLPVAVYMDDTDNEVKACDGNDLTKLNFMGFAISNSTDGNDITIQSDGIVPGFTGLDTGKLYYIQNDKTLGITPGTYSILVGVAISATQILIIKRDLAVSGSLTQITRTDSGASGNEDVTTTIGFHPKLLILEVSANASGGTDNDWEKGIIHKVGTIEVGLSYNEENIIQIFDGNIYASSDAFINGTFSILSVSATGFSIRIAWAGTFGGGGVRQITFDIDYIAIG
jgi:hypothetical protein